MLSVMAGSATPMKKAPALEFQADIHEIFEPSIAVHHGRLIKTMGDGLLVEFHSVVDALRCGIELQHAEAKRNSGMRAERQLAFRLGINLGDVIVEGDDIHGDGVNIADRLQQMADPGGIMISGTAYDQVENKLNVGYESLGEQRVKNIDKPLRVYRVRMDTGAAGTTIAGAKKSTRSWQRPTIAVGAILFLIAAGVAVWLPHWESPFKPDLRLSTKPSIAVLPFHNLSGNTEQDYFVEGMTDDLTTDLSKISGLFVISRNSAFAYRNTSVDIRAVAGQLGVRYLVVGSVRRAGQSIRINAQLVDGLTGSQVWAERYDRADTDVFAVQDEVIGRIVDALSVHLTPTEETQIARLPTANLEAYDYYLRAEQMAYVEEGRSLADTLALYKKATGLDPQFADAYAGYARTLVDVLGFDHQLVMLSPVARQQAYEAAGRALAIDPDTPRAYAVLGILQMLDGAHDEAIASVQRAVALDPNSADAYLNLALVLSYAGQPESALAAITKLLQLNPKPQPQVYDYLGLVLFMNRRYDDALQALQKVGADAHSDFGLELLAGTYARLGRSTEAKAVIAAILKRLPNQSIEGLRAIYAHHKRPEDLALRLNALREAGLPQWPHGFEGRPEDRLNGDAIRALAIGRTWAGHQWDGTPYLMQMNANGDTVQRLGDNFITGKAWVERDVFCIQAPAIIMGRKYCSPIYHNPGGTAEHQNEYAYPNTFSLWYFSPTL